MTTHHPTEIVSDCCGAEIEMKYRVYIGDGWEYCSKCKKLLKYLAKEEVEKWDTPPTDTNVNKPTHLVNIEKQDVSKHDTTVDKWEDKLFIRDSNSTPLGYWLIKEEDVEKLKKLFHSLQQAREEGIKEMVDRIISFRSPYVYDKYSSLGQQDNEINSEYFTDEGKLLESIKSDLLTKEEG